MSLFNDRIAHINRYFAVYLTVISVVLVSVFAGSPVAPSLSHLDKDIPVGFGKGMAHGFLLSVNLIRSIFDVRTGVYQIPNTGTGYNAGFFLGIILWFAIGRMGEETKATLGCRS
jgi:hypothetical protein